MSTDQQRKPAAGRGRKKGRRGGKGERSFFFNKQKSGDGSIRKRKEKTGRLSDYFGCHGARNAKKSRGEKGQRQWERKKVRKPQRTVDFSRRNPLCDGSKSKLGD